MYTITYNLRGSDGDSDSFYDVLARYSKRVYEEMDDIFINPYLDYVRYQKQKGATDGICFEEGYLELLSLGVLWVVYSGDALATDETATGLLSKLSALRGSNPHLKPMVDAFRGICLTAMMSPDLYDHMGVAAPTVEHMRLLLQWLEATGEFHFEVMRLRHLEQYLHSLDEAMAKSFLELVISTGLWFTQDSLEGLGQYTPNVERYLNELRPKRYWKEDVIFCGRRRVEYHLNMVGSEWLNHAYRHLFIERPRKVVLLPTCTRLHPDKICKARVEGAWLVCTGCSAECQVGCLRELEKQLNFQLFLVPHNSSIQESPLQVPLSQVGVVGVSCALNLISGGWMLKSLDVPAQCVILDYCGCRGHWHHEGIPTELNKDKMIQLLRY